MLCSRCHWPADGSLCAECQRIELFQLAARIAGRAILSQPNLLLRFRLVKKFFGVCVNTWETLSVLGPVHSVTRHSSSVNIRRKGDSA
jgi:hypothetical protein